MPPIDDEVANLISPERAEFVRKLRIDEGYSFRAVAAACAEEWGATWGSNQLIGEDLCRAAAELSEFRSRSSGACEAAHATN